MAQRPHNPDHWNPGVFFGFGLCLVIGCIAFAFPNIPRYVWIMGACVGLVIMAISVVPFCRKLKENWKEQGARMLAVYGMVVCAIGFAFFATYYFVSKPSIDASTKGLSVAHGSLVVAHDAAHVSQEGREIKGDDLTLAIMHYLTVTVYNPN